MVSFCYLTGAREKLQVFCYLLGRTEIRLIAEPCKKKEKKATLA